ncbi:PREDICTED: uncharacterized protein LOC107194542 [Dufourea novaeangliae]|uniref:Zonadhesin n=1 Tax=Dufourea novaeangliae TaxID=178035 RepID=A0A154P4R9_DUFNO|nr:PREDICTED: uncharacterized protein LOC107194542 [Dufourea novaeangliae]KZC06304.1 hypothetical protein WN55_10213 [Dufourea novaeangliae]
MLPLHGLLLLLVLIYHASTGHSLPATYDQRQHGQLNVQIHLKNVQIVAVMDKESLDDYTEYDYIYDYADFTVKPSQKPTVAPIHTEPPTTLDTASPVSEITTVESDTTDATVSSSSESSIVSFIVGDTNVTVTVDTEEPDVSSTEKTEDSTNENVDTRNASVKGNDGQENMVLSSAGNSTKSIVKRCRTGYIPDGKGRCRRLSQRRLSLIPIAMGLGPKFLDGLTRSTKNLAQ